MEEKTNIRTTSLIGILLLVLLVGAFLAACGASQTPTAPAAGAVTNTQPPAAVSTGSQPATTTLDDQTLLQERCTVCHNLNRITSAHKTTDQWTTTVERMVGKGAQLDAQEQQTLIDYLAQAYP